MISFSQNKLALPVQLLLVQSSYKEYSRYSSIGKNAKDPVFLTATFLALNWQMPHFLCYEESGKF